MPFDFFSAGGITAAPSARRCPDGSIDYDHYRRIAAYERAAVLAEIVGSLVQMATTRFFEWRERARSRRALAAMDERMRRDIGISRFDVLRETSKPFWRA